MLLDLTHVVTDVVIGWSSGEKDVLNIMLGYSPKVGSISPASVLDPPFEKFTSITFRVP